MPPTPKWEVRRNNPRNGPVVLPASGRQGDPPAWPLPDGPVPVEEELWAELWRTPQAVAWEDLGWTRVVGRYCRVVLAAEQLSVSAMSEARQLEDRLGLTPKAMRTLLWRIEDADADADAEKVVVSDRWKIAG